MHTRGGAWPLPPANKPAFEAGFFSTRAAGSINAAGIEPRGRLSASGARILHCVPQDSQECLATVDA